MAPSCALVQLAGGEAPVADVLAVFGPEHGKLLTLQIVTVTAVEPDAPVPVKWYFRLPPSRTTLVMVSDGAAETTVSDIAAPQADVAALLFVSPP